MLSFCLAMPVSREQFKATCWLHPVPERLHSEAGLSHHLTTLPHAHYPSLCWRRAPSEQMSAEEHLEPWRRRQTSYWSDGEIKAEVWATHRIRDHRKYMQASRAAADMMNREEFVSLGCNALKLVNFPKQHLWNLGQYQWQTEEELVPLKPEIASHINLTHSGKVVKRSLINEVMRASSKML